ncbi:hypothetical protein [Aeromicrobium sp. UC242_57]|uniref:hypothetical protein n=1 Tax=Aeromicrobium sp. UC242_57 TaxID=3374624 RepID=UPI0037A18376
MVSSPASIVSPADVDGTIGGRARRIARLVGTKILAAIFVLWGTVTVTFVVLSVLPGDRATILLNVQSGLSIPRSAAEPRPSTASTASTGRCWSSTSTTSATWFAATSDSPTSRGVPSRRSSASRSGRRSSWPSPPWSSPGS